MIEELEQLLREAPMLPLKVRQGPVSTMIDSASGLSIASLGYDTAAITRQHAALFVAAVNALPALLRVARAARNNLAWWDEMKQAEGDDQVHRLDFYNEVLTEVLRASFDALENRDA